MWASAFLVQPFLKTGITLVFYQGNRDIVSATWITLEGFRLSDKVRHRELSTGWCCSWVTSENHRSCHQGLQFLQHSDSTAWESLSVISVTLIILVLDLGHCLSLPATLRFDLQNSSCKARWHISVFLALRSLWHKDHCKFESSLGYKVSWWPDNLKVRPCLKKTQI